MEKFGHLVLQLEPEIDEMAVQMRKAKQRTEEERLLPSVPMTFVSPMILREQMYTHRMERDKIQQDARMENRQTFVGDETYFSSTPLRSLKPGK